VDGTGRGECDGVVDGIVEVVVLECLCGESLVRCDARLVGGGYDDQASRFIREAYSLIENKLKKEREKVKQSDQKSEERLRLRRTTMKNDCKTHQTHRTP
jgi:hypothetical protein